MAKKTDNKNQIPIIFENDEIFVINKPAGISVQGGAGISHPLDEEFSKQVGYKIYLVHRLDRETSGLMLVAKNPAAASKWISLISSKAVKKEYTALCFGQPQVNGKIQKSGVIDSMVSRGKREQTALTYFTVEETKILEAKTENQSQNDEKSGLKDENQSQNDESQSQKITFSKIHLKLGSGRMHQIRIHLASVGAPICGDDRHGNFKLNKIAKKAFKIKNLLLCSQILTIPGKNGKSLTFKIDLPSYFTF